MLCLIRLDLADPSLDYEVLLEALDIVRAVRLANSNRWIADHYMTGDELRLFLLKWVRDDDRIGVAELRPAA